MKKNKELEMTSTAQDLFVANPNIKTEDEILRAAFEAVKARQGIKAAKYYLWYNEDFPSDTVSEYRWLQEQNG